MLGTWACLTICLQVGNEHVSLCQPMWGRELHHDGAGPSGNQEGAERPRLPGDQLRAHNTGAGKRWGKAQPAPPVPGSAEAAPADAAAAPTGARGHSRRQACSANAGAVERQAHPEPAWSTAPAPSSAPRIGVRRSGGGEDEGNKLVYCIGANRSG